MTSPKPDRPTEDVVIKMSPELIQEMQEDWSPPVQVRLQRCDEHGWEMIARTVDTSEWVP